jgi:hypothetical protein
MGMRIEAHRELEVAAQHAFLERVRGAPPQRDGQRGPARLCRAHHRHHPAGAVGLHKSHAHQARDGVGPLGHLAQGRLQFEQAARDAAFEFMPRQRGDRAAAGAVEQRHAQHLLEQRDLFRQRGLRDRAFARRLVEAGRAHRGAEVAQLPQRNELEGIACALGAAAGACGHGDRIIRWGVPKNAICRGRRML